MQASLVNNLFEADPQTGKPVVVDGVLQLLRTHKLTNNLVGLLLSPSLEFQQLALRALGASFGIDARSVEEMLLACIDVDEIRVQALAGLHAALTRSSADVPHAEVVTKLKPLLLDRNIQIAEQAAATLATLLKTESAAESFLDNSFGGRSGDVLMELLGSSDQARVGLGLRIFDMLVQKQSGDLLKPPRTARRSSLVAIAQPTQPDNGFVQAVRTSMCISSSTRPQHVQVDSANAAAVDSPQQRQERAGKGTQSCVSMWVYLQGQVDQDGVPLFFKGCPNYEVSNTTPSRIAIRADALLTHGRVYYEVTLLSNGDIHVSGLWLGARVARTEPFLDVDPRCCLKNRWDGLIRASLRRLWTLASAPTRRATRSTRKGRADTMSVVLL
jgi:hypothetical protein